MLATYFRKRHLPSSRVKSGETKEVGECYKIPVIAITETEQQTDGKNGKSKKRRGRLPKT